MSGKGGKTRYLPLHPGTNGLINDYLDAAGHGADENGALFRPIRNNRTGRLERAITADGVYRLVRAYSAQLGSRSALMPCARRPPPMRSITRPTSPSAGMLATPTSPPADLRSPPHAAGGQPDFQGCLLTKPSSRFSVRRKSGAGRWGEYEMKITPNSLTINQLFSSTNEQFVIPAYQRRYSWRERQIWELIEDIKLIEATDTHLLGSIVCLTGHHAVGLNKLELVDGQQRLTTISVILECIRQRLEVDKELQQASDLSGLLSAKPLGGKAVRKIALNSRDGAEFDRLISNQSDGDVTEFWNKHLQLAFGIIRGWIAASTLEQIGSFLYKLRNHALVIRLDVSDAKDAFKLFETINNRGLKLGSDRHH